MEHAKHVGDVISFGLVLATLAQWLPAGAALVSIIYGSIRIYETKTMQAWVKSRKGKA